MEKEKIIKAKEKELKKLQLQEALKPYKGYFFVMLIVVFLNFMVDQFASSLNNLIYANALLSFTGLSSTMDPAYIDANASFQTTFTIIGGIFAVFIPFYKSLSDRFGRKKFLWINSLLIGIGSLIIMRATDIWGYIIGYSIVATFFEGDVHQIYLIEESPEKWRTTIVTGCKGLGILGASLLGAIRLVLVQNGGVEWWRWLAFIPVVTAAVTVIISIFLIKDTGAFRKNRIKVLTHELAELKGEEEKTESKAEQKEKGGLIRSIGYMFKHKQTRAIFFTTLCIAGAMIFSVYYPTAMGIGTLSEEEISTAAIVWPFLEGFFAIVSGVLADRIGRKKSFAIMTGLSLIGAVLWIGSINYGFGGITVGIVYGLLVGGYWAARSILTINMITESSPTEIRASVQAACAFIGGLSFNVLNLVFSWTMGIVPNHMILFLCIYAVLTLASLFFGIFKVKETKGINLNTVTEKDFE